jgi:hypothetical protein
VNWRDYEIFITRHFQRLFPGASVHHDVRKLGIISKIERQIDILIEGQIAGFSLTIVVDCKYFGKKVDVKDVDEFLGYLQDLRASKGVIVTNHGYTDAAYNRATYDTRDVEIRIIPLGELERYQSFIAIPYLGGRGAVVSAPDGWVVDANPGPKQLAAMYPLGTSRGEAFHNDGYIYVSASVKDASWPDLKHLLDVQDNNVRAHNTSPRIEYAPITLRDDCATLLRHVERADVPGTIESTVFLDYNDITFFLVLLAPSVKHADYLKKLIWVAEKLVRVSVIFDPSGRPISIVKPDG